MAFSTDPIFPATPKLYIATLTTPTAVTSRANITGTTGLVLLVPAGLANGFRLDNLTVKAKASHAAAMVGIWLYDGTTSYLWKELDMGTAITANTTTKSCELSTDYTSVNLLSAQGLYVSITVQQDITVFANGGAW